MSTAAADVIAERLRQLTKEGWTTEHDDEHDAGELAKAASCYALCAGIGIASGVGLETHYEFVAEYAKAGVPRPPWPWADTWWKPKNPRRDLVRAGALILAEIERLDRIPLKASDESWQCPTCKRGVPRSETACLWCGPIIAQNGSADS